MGDVASPKGGYLRFAILVVGACSVFGLWHILLLEERGSVLRVAFLNVGQGDAIFIEAPNGVQMLVDGGPSEEAILRELRAVMSPYDRTIDILVATHPDLDHIAGLPPVLERFSVAYIIDSGANADTPAATMYHKEVLKEGAEVILAQHRMRIWLDEVWGVWVDVLHPDRPGALFSDTNDASVVLRVVYGKHSFLLTGDASATTEKQLVSRYGNKIASDVLKAGHHGSRTSTTDTFVGVVSPRYAIISAGFNNRFGHPHQEVLRTLERFSVRVLSTAVDGRIVFTSDGHSLVRK